MTNTELSKNEVAILNELIEEFSNEIDSNKITQIFLKWKIEFEKSKIKNYIPLLIKKNTTNEIKKLIKNDS